jgi:hypothetical protein
MIPSSDDMIVILLSAMFEKELIPHFLAAETSAFDGYSLVSVFIKGSGTFQVNMNCRLTVK